MYKNFFIVLGVILLTGIVAVIILLNRNGKNLFSVPSKNPILSEFSKVINLPNSDNNQINNINNLGHSENADKNTNYGQSNTQNQLDQKNQNSNISINKNNPIGVSGTVSNTAWNKGQDTNSKTTTNSQTNNQGGSNNTSSQSQSNSGNSSITSQNQTDDTNPTSTPLSTAPKIVFIGPNGEQIYSPPTVPPVSITWAKYTNTLEKYSIDYPINWQVVHTSYRDHEALFIYAPGSDPSDPDVQYISFGWSSYYYPPTANYVGSFIQDGVPGTIYTNGALGESYIAGVFQYFNGFLILNNNVSDEVFAYIFNHMILSLDFNIQ